MTENKVTKRDLLIHYNCLKAKECELNESLMRANEHLTMILNKIKENNAILSEVEHLIPDFTKTLGQELEVGERVYNSIDFL